MVDDHVTSTQHLPLHLFFHFNALARCQASLFIFTDKRIPKQFMEKIRIFYT